MSDYKIINTIQLDTDMTNVANAIREKGNTTEKILWPDGFISAVNEITTSGSDEWIGDGNTHIWINLGEGRTSPTLGCCPNGTVTIDWGDGTTLDELTGTSIGTVKWKKHNYINPGDYIITLTVNGNMYLYGKGDNAQYAYLLRNSTGMDYLNQLYLNSIKKIEIGNNVEIGSYAFYSCPSLSKIFIPNSVTKIGSYAFKNSNIRSIILPNSITYLEINAFQGSKCLKSIALPNSITYLSSYLFSSCQSLSKIFIPNSVTKIGSYAFEYCYGMKIYDFSTHTTIPSLSSSNAFTYMANDCEIHVPISLVEEWKNATNWSNYAEYIIGV